MNIGCNVDVAFDATEALVKLKMNHYDLIITDITMPKINGYEFVERLRNDEMYADIPVLVMSSITKDIAMTKLQKFKIEGYLQKDLFNQEKFVEKVKEVLEKYHNK